MDFSQLLRSKYNSAIGSAYAVCFVVCLLLARSPTTVVRCVVSKTIFAVYRSFWVRFLPHILEELGKRSLPFWAHFYAFAAVSRVRSVTWLQTSLPHRKPCHILWRPCFIGSMPVLAVWLSGFSDFLAVFGKQTSTALYAAFSRKGLTFYHLSSPTVAQAFPKRSVVLCGVSTRIPYCSQAPTTLACDVFVSCHSGIIQHEYVLDTK